MVRLKLICSGATVSTRANAFPGDEPLEEREHEAATALASQYRNHNRAFSGPSLRARQTAEALGLEARIEPALDDLDAGRWIGKTITEIVEADPDAWRTWLSVPEAAPHGGESIARLIDRAGAFLNALPEGTTVAVTHAAVIRAAIVRALDAPATAFWAIDVAPLAEVRLHGDNGRWRLRAIVQPRDRR